MPVQHQQDDAETQQEHVVDDVDAELATLGLVELHDPGGARRHQHVVRQACERARQKRDQQPGVDPEAAALVLADHRDAEGQRDHGEVQLDPQLRRDAVAGGDAQR